MISQIDTAHSARAEVTEKFVLAQKKSLIATFQELFTLPFCDQLFFDQKIRNRLRVTRN